MTLQQKFEKFLRKNKSIRAFKKNLKNECGPDETISKHLDAIDNNPKRIINSAFVYSETPQGTSYWNDLNNKWLQQIKEVENN